MASKGKGDGKGWWFSARERRAVLFLLPLVAVAVWILWSAVRPRYDDSVDIIGDRIAEDMRENQRSDDRRPNNGGRDGRHHNGTRERIERQNTTAETRGREEPNAIPMLSDFDPNTVTYEEMRVMSIAPNTAAGIVKYRLRGKVFRIPEDFATCYGITDSIYAALKPYIRIGEEYHLEPAVSNRADGSDSGDGVTADKSISAAGVRHIAHAPQAAQTTQAAAPQPQIAQSKWVKTDLNSADSVELVAVRGIGARTAADIIAYREKLGGFHSVGQLKELKVMTERNYETIIEQIWADSCKIRKIDINFASPNTVSQHPYISDRKLRRILKNRQLRGGWSRIEDMIEDDTLTPEEAARLAPYLYFTIKPEE